MKKVLIYMILGAVLITPVYAEFWGCFFNGDKIDYCNPDITDRTCSSSGGCRYCMKVYNETAECYIGGSWNRCNAMAEQQCNFQGSTNIDEKAPNITIVSPEPDNSSIFTSTRIPFIINVDERSDLYFYDNIYGRGRWTRICKSCYGVNQGRRFKEGPNDLTIRAEDSMNNMAFKGVTFFTDSRKPRIGKTLPKKGFATNQFTIEYTEANPVEMKLYIGNKTEAYEEEPVDLNASCFELKRGRMTCIHDKEMKGYNGQEIMYWVTLKDIAGNMDESRRYTLEVDTTDPEIDSFNYSIMRRSVTFNFSITEKNFDEIKYIDHNSSRPRWRRLCSRLRDGSCITRKSFTLGQHLLSLQVFDEAGNYANETADFTIY